LIIARKGRYIPDAVRNLLLGAEIVVAAVIILRLVLNVNVSLWSRFRPWQPRLYVSHSAPNRRK